ncbi:hypothetical protein BH10PSE17_BH10PSE17_39070 [soil metagenome]
MKMPLLPLALAVSLCACSSPSIAVENMVRPAFTLANVSIVDRTTGQTLTTYRKGNELWVAGEPGHRYSIAVQNATGARVLGVMSVDGINVISGQTAWRNELGAQTGYVFAGRERAEITGWRKTQADVAVFEFAAPSASYAAQTGRGNDIGAIGVALFRERVEQPVYTPPPVSYAPPVASPPPSAQGFRNEARSDAAAESPAPARDAAGSVGELSRKSERAAAPAAPSLGTAHGERQAAWVDYTSFVRASTTPDQIIVIRYDRRETLVARGIIPSDVPRLPDPFPVAGGFVPDPPRH